MSIKDVGDNIVQEETLRRRAYELYHLYKFLAFAGNRPCTHTNYDAMTFVLTKVGREALKDAKYI